MSIAPPSDIVLDVAQAADPRRLQAATTKLATLAAGVAGTSLAGTGVAGTGTGAADFGAMLAKAAGPASADAGASALRPDHPAPQRALSPYQKFEAVLLQSFVQEMLPKGDQLYGDAASADAYRGMMAEQIADQLARSGRVGIARMIEKAHGPQAAATAPAAAAAAAPAPEGA